MPKLLRQGDVLLVPAAIPGKATVVPPENNRIILALGEATGHHHSIAVADQECELYSVADEIDRYLRVRSRAVALTHQEHATIAVPQGDYRVVRQREYSPEAIRQVVD